MPHDPTADAIRLRDICDLHGYDPSLRGATPDEEIAIRAAFEDAGVALPEGLMAVYRITLGIPQIQHSFSVLGKPIQTVLDDLHVDHALHECKLEDLDKEGVLELGHNADALLLIDRKERAGIAPVYQDDGSVEIEDPTDFDEAFHRYVEKVVADVREEFED